MRGLIHSLLVAAVLLGAGAPVQAQQQPAPAKLEPVKPVEAKPIEREAPSSAVGYTLALIGTLLVLLLVCMPARRE
jgi:hypothetical protein